MRPLCIYHGNCADGFGAAWVVRRFFIGEVDFHAGVYQEAPPDVTGRDVILVDFSYKRDVIEKMRRTANSIRVIDHHKTAIEDLSGNLIEDAGSCPVELQFDLARSGAGLAWDIYFPDVKRPALINHIEDRDLWKFALPQTREIQASLFSFPYDFTIWDRLIRDTSTAQLAEEGRAIERKHHKDVAELVKATQRWMWIGDQFVPVANLPYTLTSDAGHLMCGMTYQDGCTTVPFAACYWDTEEGRVFSLRSVGENDVSAVAKRYGGGGHKNASGFKTAIGWEGDRPAP